MSRDDVYYFGNVVKTHGFKGELGLKLDVDFPEDYSNLESVFVELNNELIPFFFERFQLNKKGLAIVKLEGVDSEEEASQLLKAELYLPLAILPPLEGTKFYFHEVIGFKAIDKNYGLLGKITEINDSTAQPIMTIIDGDYEILVPVIDEFILALDREKGEMTIDTPEGLVDFYRNE